MARRFLAILTAYDPALPGTRTLYVTTGTGFLTAPSETPASQAFDPVLAQPLDLARRVQGLTGGAVVPSLGTLEIHNRDGAYDAWAAYAFDGRALVIREGPETGAYPADYPVLWEGTMDRVDVTRERVVIRVRDRVAELDSLLQDERFAGDNVPPDGLEGEADLEGVVKPRCYGLVQNMPVPLVNAAKLIYQVNDGPVQAIDDVRDNGVPLGTYAPIDFTRANASTGGQCAATDGTTIVLGDTLTGAAAIRTTTDGVSFTTIGSLPFSVAAEVTTGMAYSPSLDRFVAVTGSNNSLLGTGGEIATSDDAGATWTIRTTPAACRYMNVRWCPVRELFLAVGWDGTNGVIHTSPTGVTWTARTSGTTERVWDVAVGGPVLVAVALANGRVLRSDDGITWTGQTLANAQRQAALFYNGWYFIQGSANGRLYRSRDGLSWVDVFTGGGVSDGIVFSLAGVGPYVVAVLASSNAAYNLAYSVDDGATWIAAASGVTGDSPFTALPFGDRWYVFCNSDTDKSAAPATYATLTDLEDDTLAPSPGLYKWISHASGTYVRLGAPPFGTVTVDARTGATAADRTAGQLFVDVLTDAGYTTGDWSATDITNLDTADNSEVGLVLTGDETVADALDALARTVGAWWGVDASNVFRVQQLTAPSGSPTFAITAPDVLAIERLASSDPLLGRPSVRTTLRYALSDTRALDGTVVAADTAVLTTHPLAQSTDEDTLFTNATDAQAEATRRQTLRGTARSAYRVTVPLDDFTGVDVGDVGTLTHPRFGLSGGVSVRVLGVEPDAANRRVTFTLWR